MTLLIHNSMGKKLEKFVPLGGNEVKMYACGITAYDYCHLGHARAAVVFDIIRNYLEYSSYRVTYVRNFTDVDDKIIERARTLKVDCLSLAEKYIAAYKADMALLGVRVPDVEPKATEHIDEIITLVSILKDKGFAYECNGDVYFDITRFHNYGRLSNRRLEDMVAGARVSIDERKHHPLDFALWKASKPDEPSWSSPWGDGRPGWHIECSAMSMKYLGEQLDIHGGGEDLLFPHHENEIAQSEAITGKPFAKYWLHNGFVRINREKMSKSTGNFFLMKDLFMQYEPEVLRYFLMGTHYRSPLDYSDISITDAGRALKKLRMFVHNVTMMVSEWEKIHGKVSLSEVDISAHFSHALTRFESSFRDHMDADFNTPRALGSFFELTRSVNNIINSSGFQCNQLNCVALKGLLASILRNGAVLGILSQNASLGHHKRSTFTAEEKTKITQQLVLREEKRRTKQWADADKIRQEVQTEFGIIVVDKPSEIIVKDGEGFEVFSIEKQRNKG